MSGTAADIGEATVPKDDSYGPDRTLVQVADWLTENAKLFDDFFAAAPFVSAFRIEETMLDQHPQEEHESYHPRAHFFSESSNGREVEYNNLATATTKGPQYYSKMVAMRPLVAAAGDNAERLRARCVTIDEVYFGETIYLRLPRTGVCEGRIRYHKFSLENETPENYDVLEQYFTWARNGPGYAGHEILMRLWSPQLLDALALSPQDFQHLPDEPATLCEHRQIRLFRETGFRALFQMRRTPDRVVVHQDHIETRYLGQFAAVRAENPTKSSNRRGR
jgi:hypothetical protein